MTQQTPLQPNLNIELPPPPQPVGNYVPVQQVGKLLYTSGMLPLENGALAYTGPVGSISLTIEDGYKAARLCVLNGLSAVQHHLGGSLESIAHVVKVTGFVSSAPHFYQQPKVINGASDTLVEVFGEAGKHARSALGVVSLPMDASVEVELILELK